MGDYCDIETEPLGKQDAGVSSLTRLLAQHPSQPNRVSIHR